MFSGVIPKMGPGCPKPAWTGSHHNRQTTTARFMAVPLLSHGPFPTNNRSGSNRTCTPVPIGTLSRDGCPMVWIIPPRQICISVLSTRRLYPRSLLILRHATFLGNSLPGTGSFCQIASFLENVWLMYRRRLLRDRGSLPCGRHQRTSEYPPTVSTLAPDVSRKHNHAPGAQGRNPEPL